MDSERSGGRMALDFDREIASYIDAARRDFLHQRGAITAAQAAKGALRSGATGKMIARAANASALGVAQTLSTETLASAKARSKRLGIRQTSVRRALDAYRAELRELADFNLVAADSPAALAAFQQMITDGGEDVRRLLQRHEDGRSGGPPLSWPESHPALAFWISNIIAGLAMFASILALFRQG